MRTLVASLALGGLAVALAACTTASVELHEDGRVIGTAEATGERAAVAAAQSIMETACKEHDAELAEPDFAPDVSTAPVPSAVGVDDILPAIELAKSLLTTHKATVKGTCVRRP